MSQADACARGDKFENGASVRLCLGNIKAASSFQKLNLQQSLLSHIISRTAVKIIFRITNKTRTHGIHMYIFQLLIHHNCPKAQLDDCPAARIGSPYYCYSSYPHVPSSLTSIPSCFLPDFPV
jgi:hypothetical protein